MRVTKKIAVSQSGRAKLAALAFGLAFAVAASAATARDLTVVGWGGSSQAAQRKLYFQPFSEKTGLKIVEDSWSGGIGILRTKVQGGNANWDMVQVEVDELLLGCDEGLYEKIDWKMMGGKDAFIDAAYHDCGVGAALWSVAIVYDADRLSDGPKSWADFWDVARFPGKRALRKGAKYTLEFALMADGVPATDVYKVLRTPEGVERAFAKLDRIKPHMVWWTAGSQPMQLLASGEVVMTSSYASRAFNARRVEKRNFNTVWKGSIYAVDSWAILKGSPHKDAAMQLIAFATSGEVQKDYPPLSGSSATNKAAIAAVDPEVAPLLPTWPANMENAQPVDAEFWTDNSDQLTQRFNAWAAR
jgi:putative spermidine/putrescine transport system substrate-binding protein